MRRFLLTLSVAATLPLAANAQTTNEPFPMPASTAPSSPFQAVGATQPSRLVVTASQSPHEVTPQAGTWFICAACYTGPNSGNYAEQVVRQLREKHKMPAYVFSYADLQRRKEEEEYQRRRLENPDLPMRRRVTRIESQRAVLAGGYRDEKAANEALKKFKKLPPPEVYGADGQPVTQNIQFQLTKDNATPTMNRGTSGVSQPADKLGNFSVNPYARGFIIRNPTLPKQQTASANDKPDPLWKKLNSKEDYSLLKCKKQFTLVIKCFGGAASIQSSESTGPRKTSGLANNVQEIDILDAMAIQAHELARVLRLYNLETYVLHMRQGSIVTVGAFDSLEDPALADMQQKLRSGGMKYIQGNPLGRELDDFMMQPMPMRVPKL